MENDEGWRMNRMNFFKRKRTIGCERKFFLNYEINYWDHKVRRIYSINEIRDERSIRQS